MGLCEAVLGAQRGPLRHQCEQPTSKSTQQQQHGALCKALQKLLQTTPNTEIAHQKGTRYELHHKQRMHMLQQLQLLSYGNHLQAVDASGIWTADHITKFHRPKAFSKQHLRSTGTPLMDMELATLITVKSVNVPAGHNRNAQLRGVASAIPGPSTTDAECYPVTDAVGKRLRLCT
jgi:hypothetical protein